MNQCFEVAMMTLQWAPSEFWTASPQEFYLAASLHVKRMPEPRAAPRSNFTAREIKRMKELLNA